MLKVRRVDALQVRLDVAHRYLEVTGRRGRRRAHRRGERLGERRKTRLELHDVVRELVRHVRWRAIRAAQRLAPREQLREQPVQFRSVEFQAAGAIARKAHQADVDL